MISTFDPSAEGPTQRATSIPPSIFRNGGESRMIQCDKFVAICVYVLVLLDPNRIKALEYKDSAPCRSDGGVSPPPSPRWATVLSHPASPCAEPTRTRYSSTRGARTL